ncbi:phosphate butyryltransferase [Bacillus dakarensis]|uniref:phosphate butyryltransferase n=1 Tax=Robertmurraya dakarensis TaxID=1926278 RepID=UPI000980A4C4|nr:phosphate butyryltransferase [Bacillus dakarensis]
MLLHSLVNRAAHYNKQTIAIAAADEKDILETVSLALEHNLAKFQLFGDQEKIFEIIHDLFPKLMNNDSVKVVHAPEKEIAAELAVGAVSRNEATILMKGHIPTAMILKAVLNKEYGLRKDRRTLSHVAVFEIPEYDRFIILTDAGMHIAPSLEDKVEIITNAVEVARSIGIEQPLVAPIAAVEVINPAMAATIDAALLSQMNNRGQIKNCVVDGPLALDNAISSIAAEQKGIKSMVAGKADILLMPSIEVGNVLYKSLIYFAQSKVGGMIAGARAPIVLTSRSDSAESKLYSLGLAICTAQQ